MIDPTKTPQFSQMPWYPRDFASSTRTWPLIARAVYRELLDSQWDIGGAQPGILPDDAEQLRMLARANKDEWKVAWRFVANKFRRVKGGRQNVRLEQHRKSAYEKYLARVKGAEEANRERARKKAERSLSERSAYAQRPSEADERSANAQRRFSVTPPTPLPTPNEEEDVRGLRRSVGAGEEPPESTSLRAKQRRGSGNDL